MGTFLNDCNFELCIKESSAGEPNIIARWEAGWEALLHDLDRLSAKNILDGCPVQSTTINRHLDLLLAGSGADKRDLVLLHLEQATGSALTRVT